MNEQVQHAIWKMIAKEVSTKMKSFSTEGNHEELLLSMNAIIREYQELLEASSKRNH